ncbi:MAG: hypothetical protein PHU72_01740 [Dethiosulfovibrio sp.]|nr:hypothetical protein [Dethiosulfovibrio sp.]
MNLRKIITLAMVVLLVTGTLYAKSKKTTGEGEVVSAQPSGEGPTLLDLGAPG